MGHGVCLSGKVKLKP